MSNQFILLLSYRESERSKSLVYTDIVFNRLKLKRPQTAKMYRDLLDGMYADAEAKSLAGKAKL